MGQKNGLCPLGVNITTFTLYMLVDHWTHFVSMVLFGGVFLVEEHIKHDPLYRYGYGYKYINTCMNIVYRIRYILFYFTLLCMEVFLINLGFYIS
jgi:hypothetical protein